jgi:hypothetical protein
MPVNYPTSLDDFTDPLASDPTTSPTVPHATQHANVNTAVEQLEQKVGVDASLPSGPSGVLGANGVGKSIWRAIANADVAAAAGIAKSKLAALGIVDADVDPAASIAVAKLSAGGTGNRLLRTSDGVTPTWGQVATADIAANAVSDHGGAQFPSATFTLSTPGNWVGLPGAQIAVPFVTGARFLAGFQVQGQMSAANARAQFRIVQFSTTNVVCSFFGYVGPTVANVDFMWDGTINVATGLSGTLTLQFQISTVDAGTLSVNANTCYFWVMQVKK